MSPHQETPNEPLDENKTLTFSILGGLVLITVVIALFSGGVFSIPSQTREETTIPQTTPPKEQEQLSTPPSSSVETSETTPPAPSASETKSPNPFESAETMVKWFDQEITQCDKWNMHLEGNLKGADCKTINTVIVHSSSKLFLDLAKSDFKDYDPRLVGKSYVGGDNWMIFSTPENLKKVSDRVGIPSEKLE